MTTIPDLSILREPIPQLAFTNYFVERSAQMEFSTIQDIIDRDEDETAVHPAFTWKWFNELIEFLLKRDLAYLLDEDSRIEKHEQERLQKRKL